MFQWNYFIELYADAKLYKMHKRNLLYTDEVIYKKNFFKLLIFCVLYLNK